MKKAYSDPNFTATPLQASASTLEMAPQEASAQFIEKLKASLQEAGWDFDPAKSKILMLTHNAIAAERGYPNLATIFERKEAFSKKEDATIAFLADTLEPVCQAYSAGNFGEMFRLLGGVPTIRKTSDKAEWRAQLDQLLALRETGTIGEVIDTLKDTERFRLADRVAGLEEEIAQLGPEETEEESNSLKRHRVLRKVAYKEIVSFVEFINGFTPLATQHSVKGAEFENVLVILSSGWNHYNWPKFLELLNVGSVPTKDLAGFMRARNLFYVAVSRPKKRLAVLATQMLSPSALSAAATLFGTDNVISISEP